MNVFSLSFGKDSMATLILAAEQGIPTRRKKRLPYVQLDMFDMIGERE